MNRLYPVSFNSPPTTTTAQIDADDTTIPVTELEVFPPGRNLAVLRDGTVIETIEYTGKSSSSGSGNLTGVTRAFQGDAQIWDSGTEISRLFTAYDYDALRENLNDLTILEGQVEGDELSTYDLVYLGPDGEWYQTDANVDVSSAGQLGIVIGTGVIQTSGIVTNEAWAFTPGDLLYISDTPGTLTSTPGTIQEEVGYAITSTSIYLLPFIGETPMILIKVFTDNANHPIVGRRITFSPVIQSKYGVTTYDWDFGDVSTHGTEGSPVHVYSEAGTYTIILTITDGSGNTFKTYHTLTVIAESARTTQGKMLKSPDPLDRITPAIEIFSQYNGTIPTDVMGDIRVELQITRPP